MANLIALKFQVGLHTVDTKDHKAGHAKYPDFNQVSLANRNGMDWCKFIDSIGVGMQADKTSGHKELSIESPLGEQTCVIAVPQAFATEALALFPEVVSQLTPVDFETFYNDKAHKHEPEEKLDMNVLNAIKAKEDLGLAVPEKAAAIDPKNDAPGIVENKSKTWARNKLVAGHEIV